MVIYGQDHVAPRKGALLYTPTHPTQSDLEITEWISAEHAKKVAHLRPDLADFRDRQIPTGVFSRMSESQIICQRPRDLGALNPIAYMPQPDTAQAPLISPAQTRPGPRTRTLRQPLQTSPATRILSRGRSTNACTLEMMESSHNANLKMRLPPSDRGPGEIINTECSLVAPKVKLGLSIRPAVYQPAYVSKKGIDYIISETPNRPAEPKQLAPTPALDLSIFQGQEQNDTNPNDRLAPGGKTCPKSMYAQQRARACFTA